MDFRSVNTLSRSPYSFGSHVAVVEVSRENGAIKILQYTGVHDSGKVINPMLYDGQIHGAIAQGIGQALWEGMVYDDAGQPLSGSMMDYVLPKSIDLPDFDLDSTFETPSPITALGVKGIGELPTLAAPGSHRQRRDGRLVIRRCEAHRYAANAGKGVAGAAGTRAKGSKRKGLRSVVAIIGRGRNGKCPALAEIGNGHNSLEPGCGQRPPSPLGNS